MTPSPSETAALVERLRMFTRGTMPAMELLRERAADMIEALSSALAETKARLAEADAVVAHTHPSMRPQDKWADEAVLRHASRTSPPAATAERGETT